jgi:polyribonucleotide nucleotidyltransferase
VDAAKKMREEFMNHRYEIDLGGRPLVLETGELAQQAGGAVTLQYGETMLLATVTASSPRRGIDFFPLSVEFEERMYAAGRIPGSFFRREGRPTTAAVLSARLTDRPLRPLFPKGYMDDTQIVITVLSVDMENPPDTLGTIAASAALMISDVPFDGPVGSVRVGHVNGELVMQPIYPQYDEMDLSLVVAGTKDAIMMVEAEAGEVPEDLLVEAMAMGQEAVARIAELQEQMREDVGKEKRAYTAKEVDDAVLADVEKQIGAELESALSPTSGFSKDERDSRRKAIRTSLFEDLDDDADKDALDTAYEAIEARIVRGNILTDGARPDGRGTADLRPLKASVGMIPRTHGSALFQRGETQVLSLTTLAGSSLAQRTDDLTPEDSKRFMHHYNFPPYSVGETGRIGSTGRRELGHGMLGERAMSAVLPSEADFPYVMRIVSEVLSSNGSTSMASVCASIMSMMDAGVPIKAPIAGIAMGLIKGEGDDEVAVLTDIAGLEDHLGDMDFKVAGSRDGVTALQMDIKVKGISLEIMSRALAQAREARMEILDVMLEAIAEPREELSPYAPRMYSVDVPQDKIGVIIGPGGKTIRQIEAESGASINIADDGTVTVAAADGPSAELAINAIKSLVKEVEPGEVYTGKVTRIMPFGAFVEVLPGKDALVHISELAEERVNSVEDVVSVGDEVKVVVTEIDNLGRINASRRALLGKGDGPSDGGGRGGSGGGGGRGPREERGDRGSRGPDRGSDRGPDRSSDRGRDRDRDGGRERYRARDRSRDEERRSEAPRARDEERQTETPRARDEERSTEAPRARDEERSTETPRARDEERSTEAPRARDEERRSEAPRARDEERRSEAPRARDEERRSEAPRARDEERGSEAPRPRDEERGGEGERTGDDGGAPRRRRRRRRRSGGGDGGSGNASGGSGSGSGSAGSGSAGSGSGNERPERQPDDYRGSRSRAFGRTGVRRDSGNARNNDEPLGPPPPPRPDFGAPAQH